jgi:insulysin
MHECVESDRKVCSERSRGLLDRPAQDFAKVASKREKWYGTQYAEQKVDRKAWMATKLAALSIPKPNPFIPTNFELRNAQAPPKGDTTEPPKLVKDSDTWRVFAKADTTYAQPKAYANFLVSQPDDVLGSKTTPRTSALSKLYRYALDEALTEFTYDAAVAGLSYNCEFTQRGISLSFSGFNDKLPAYVASVSKAIADFVPSDEAKLAKYKDVIARDLASFPFDQPYEHAGRFSQLCTMQPAYLPTDVLKELESVTLADLQTWTKSLWSKGYGQALLQGNINEQDALDMAKAVEEALALKPLPEELRGAPKLAKLPLVQSLYGNVLQREEPNPANPNSATIVQFQNADRENLKTQMAMEVLAIIMGNPFFADLRTKQQLGYIVYGGVSNKDGVRSLIFTAQSSVVDAPYITDRIFDFTENFSLKSISDDQVREPACDTPLCPRCPPLRCSHACLRSTGQIRRLSAGLAQA